jgi:hypothetical protein
MTRLHLPLITLLAACYTYRPLPTPTPEPGQRVSAQLTTDGSRDLTGQIGPEVLHVEGNVVEADSSGMDMDVLEIESYRGFRSDWHGERLRLPREAVAGMQQRRLSVGGTGLMAGVLAAGLYAVYRVLGGGDSSTGGNGQGGGQGR